MISPSFGGDYVIEVGSFFARNLTPPQGTLASLLLRLALAQRNEREGYVSLKANGMDDR
jgi:hypothetical protein